MTDWHNCNWIDRDDGLYYCEGLHERSAECEWAKLSIDDVKELVAEVRRLQEELDQWQAIAENRANGIRDRIDEICRLRKRLELNGVSI